MKTKLNPVTILGVWTVSMILLTPVFMFTSDIGASGGEQKLLSTFATMTFLILIGATIICVVTPFLFKAWIKSNKWFIALAIFLSIPTSKFIWQYSFENRYSFTETHNEIEGNKFDTKTEYYDNNEKFVRSTSYWKNGKRDSTWTVLSRDGKVISEKLYRNDSLILEK